MNLLATIEYAFKCAYCGSLEEAQVAGENATPTACHICGRGVSYDPVTGIRQLHPENWIVLADLEGEDLAALHEFHKFDPELHSIVRWDPLPAADPDRTPVTIAVEASETVGGEDVQS